MNWYYKILGGHVHVRVFMNGGKCGDLVFRDTEFKELISAQAHLDETHPNKIINFKDETP